MPNICQTYTRYKLWINKTAISWIEWLRDEQEKEPKSYSQLWQTSRLCHLWFISAAANSMNGASVTWWSFLWKELIAWCLDHGNWFRQSQFSRLKTDERIKYSLIYSCTSSASSLGIPLQKVPQFGICCISVANPRVSFLVSESNIINWTYNQLYISIHHFLPISESKKGCRPDIYQWNLSFLSEFLVVATVQLNQSVRGT